MADFATCGTCKEPIAVGVRPCPNCGAPDPAEGELVSRNDRGFWLSPIFGLLPLAAVCFIVIGLFYAFTYSSGPVGGDAYNYIIRVTRGVVLVTSGVGVALLAILWYLTSRDRR